MSGGVRFYFGGRTLLGRMTQTLLGELREDEMWKAGRFRQLLHFPENPVQCDERKRAAITVQKMPAENEG